MEIQPCLANLLEAIVALRKAAGLSQAQLANRVRYQPSYLSKAERGLLGVPSQSLVTAIDAELSAGGALIELRRHAWLEDKGSRAGIAWRGIPEEVDKTDRRQLMVGGGAVAVGPAMSSDALEAQTRSIGDPERQAGKVVDLSGSWWAAWQTFRDGEEIHSSQEAALSQHRDHIHMEAVSRGLDVDKGGYLWWGELRIWDNEIVMGWYVASDGPVRSKGTVFFSLHPHGDRLTGRWVGLSYDGLFIEGWGAMARSESTALLLLERLRTQQPKVA